MNTSAHACHLAHASLIGINYDVTMKEKYEMYEAKLE